MLKNILSLLLSKFYSKQESEAVGHQAMPKLSQYIDLTSNATANVENTYVAPTDGYFVCATKGGEWSGVNVWGTLDAGAPGASGIQGKVFTPCVKGASVHYIIYGTIHLVRFYKTIGGVQTLKSALLQGGGLCRLSHWYSSLRRCSLQVRRNGCSKTLSPLKEPQLLSQIKDRALHLLRTLLRQTDCLGFGIKPAKGLALLCPVIATATEGMQQGGSYPLPTDGQLKTLFTYLKEKLLSWIPTDIRQVLPECGSTRLLNSAVGGASC